MLRQGILFLCFLGCLTIGWSLPQQPKPKRPAPVFKNKTGGLELPDNATMIRDNIVDTFSCQDRIYGYYADMENECQVFHVCLPQARGAIRWSFICPAETVFNQATFVCTRTENSIPCEESEKFYNLNEAIGKEIEEEEESDSNPAEETEDESANAVDEKEDEKRKKKEEPISGKPSTRQSRLLNRERAFRRRS